MSDPFDEDEDISLEVQEDNISEDIKRIKPYNQEEMSIVRQSYLLYKEFISPPEIEIPVRDYSQKSENSGLPDNDYYEDLSVPVGESLSQFCFRLSTKANEAWKAWTDTNGDPFLEDGELVAPIVDSIEKTLFNEKDIEYYTRLKRLNFVEEKTFYVNHVQYCTRLLQESVFRSNNLDANSVSYYSGNNDKYFGYISVESEFSDILRIKKEFSRCNGKFQIKKTEGTVIPKNVPSNYSPSYSERAYFSNLTHYQTSVWRKQYRAEQDTEYLSNTMDQDDDPDYINPLSLSSRNFNIYPPASRCYNATFVIYKKDGTSFKMYPSKNIKKDYTGISSIEYMLRSKNIDFDKVVIEEQAIKSELYPSCKFEPDLRVSYCSKDKQEPDFVSYKKVDTSSLAGKKILQLLNEQPHLWTELYFSQDDQRKLVVYYSLQHPKDNDVYCVFWLYVDTNRNPLSKPRFMKKKITLPQYIPHYAYSVNYNNLPNFLKKKFLLGISVRVSKDCYYSQTVIENGIPVTKFFNFKQIEQNFIESLKEKGFNKVDVIEESSYNNILIYRFVNSMFANVSRKTLFEKLNNDFVEVR